MISRYRTDRENHPSSQSYTMKSTPQFINSGIERANKGKRLSYFITTTEDDFYQKIS
jgi:hypothetical protein